MLVKGVACEQYQKYGLQLSVDCKFDMAQLRVNMKLANLTHDIESLKHDKPLMDKVGFQNNIFIVTTFNMKSSIRARALCLISFAWDNKMTSLIKWFRHCAMCNFFIYSNLFLHRGSIWSVSLLRDWWRRWHGKGGALSKPEHCSLPRKAIWWVETPRLLPRSSIPLSLRPEELGTGDIISVISLIHAWKVITDLRYKFRGH